MNNNSAQATSRHLANRDLARRSRFSGLVYLALYFIVILFTPYAADHTGSALAVSAVIVLSAGLRTWLVISFDTLYAPVPARWLAGFTALTLLVGGTWGLFCAHALLEYGLAWTAMLALLSTAGISAGAITTLSIHRKLITAFLALLLLPATVATLFIDNREAYAVTLMFLTYFVFMFSVARNINREYWQALDNTLLLDQRARELEASNQELESYSYSIAHDLRTPLRSIIGFSQILMQELHDGMTTSNREDLERVIQAGKHMAKLIDDILDLSRITRHELEPGDVDLSGLVQAQADQLRAQQPGRAVDFTVQPGLHARGDARLLALALQNLVENAWKFTGGRDRAEITFSATPENKVTVYSLCDNGVGFDMAYAGKLFKPFERLHQHREFSGTGIGLATVQRIIVRHGGRIWAESVPGRGACFYFTLA